MMRFILFILLLLTTACDVREETATQPPPKQETPIAKSPETFVCPDNHHTCPIGDTCGIDTDGATRCFKVRDGYQICPFRPRDSCPIGDICGTSNGKIVCVHNYVVCPNIPNTMCPNGYICPTTPNGACQAPVNNSGSGFGGAWFVLHSMGHI